MIDPQALIDDLRASVTSDENKLIVANLALHTTRIATMALTDPAAAEREAGYVRASLANLTASEAVAVQAKLTSWLAGLVRAAILGA